MSLPRIAEKLASKRSECVLCPDEIEKGEPIRKLEAAPFAWVHTRCFLERQADGESLVPDGETTTHLAAEPLREKVAAVREARERPVGRSDESRELWMERLDGALDELEQAVGE